MDEAFAAGRPLTATLGSGRLLEAFEEGLVGMCIGEIRYITIPVRLAFRNRGVPRQISSDANVFIVVQLLNIEERPVTDIKNFSALIEIYKLLEFYNRMLALEYNYLRTGDDIKIGITFDPVIDKTFYHEGLLNQILIVNKEETKQDKHQAADKDKKCNKEKEAENRKKKKQGSG